jgi:uncharacterized membrane protein
MMEIDGGAMLVAALACALALPLFLLSLGFVGVRALRGSRWSSPTRTARTVLDRRLAAGEIDVDEYYERESALRSTDSATARRR